MAQLIVETGPQRGARTRLSRDNPCSIGSDPECDLRLTSTGIATRHLVVKALRTDGFGVKGMESEFHLNGAATEAARLSDGDVLEIGAVRIRYTETTDAPPAQDPTPAPAAPAKAKAKLRATAAVPKTLGGFAISEVLGSGGMGVVYRAEQKSLNREVALKVLSTELTQDPVFVAQFRAEARAAARLHHPNVVQVFDVGHEGETYYYSMELMEGSLEARLKKEGKLEVDEALSVVADAARGLAFAESMDLIHRDIKPDNLMFDRHGVVKLADLGLAMNDEDDEENNGNNNGKVVGTPHFMSPEQALRKPLDHRSDLYSLGCTFYRLLTGATPFRRPTVKEILKAHVKDAPDPINKEQPEVSAEIAAIVDKLLQKDPADRYQSANELLEEIEAVLTPPSRKALWISAIAVAVIVAGGGLAWGLTRPEGETITKTERVVEKDPRVAGLLEQIRQKDAELARLRVMAAGLSDAARATELEKVATEHADTEAATIAKRDAARVRDAMQRAAAAAQVREQAITAAAQQLRDGVQSAIDRGDYRAAIAGLDPKKIPADVREAEPVTTTVRELGAALENHARARLSGLKADFDTAVRERSPDRSKNALAAVAAVVDPEGGWPDRVLPERKKLAAWVTSARAAVDGLEASIANEAAAGAWQIFVDGWLGETGVMTAVHGFEFERAHAGAGKVSGALVDQPPHAHATALAESLQRASGYLARFQAAAEGGDLTYRPRGAEASDARTVSGFALAGDTPGLEVRTGPAIRTRTEVIPLETLRDDLLSVFRIPGADPEAADRAAFIAWATIASNIQRGRRWLAAFDPADPDSGGDAYRGSAEAIAAAAQVLDRVDEPWALGLNKELNAALGLARGLRAFSSGRNLSAKNQIQALLRDHPESLVVRALR